ncbi:SDR family oxidoreductase [Paenibacillus ginsengarvi]|uniref:NAD-dependent epimerase/dehydratase family protein n=1 Tax=Paenibacillus ginsengarvi TaxID=400777 RepID=A0A3B0C6S6_9BACL|nr:NmrA family NAD(P)-binding protein [Paenibacillus ginsengarvi]RKN81975.1 NAD-dependent epimerase/dehydratase family protein [Paenibacillus ginsengarvi]
MKVGVIGGTGLVGSRLVRELSERNVSVRVLARNPEKHRGSNPGVEWVRGDLEAPGSLEGAFDQLDAVFLLNGLAQNETNQGIAAVTAIQKAGIRKIVYLSVPMAEHMLHIPHIKSKIGVEDAIKHSGIAYTILRPNNFYQNDCWFRDAILQYGVYPQPLGTVGLHRVDIGDIAHAAANALLLKGYEGGEYPLNGPEALTGETIAETYSRHTGTDVRYAGNDLDAWYRQAVTAMPEWLARDFQVMYASFQQFGCLGTEQDYARQKELLLREPRSFDDFVAETVTNWKNE